LGASREARDAWRAISSSSRRSTSLLLITPIFTADHVLITTDHAHTSGITRGARRDLLKLVTRIFTTGRVHEETLGSGRRSREARGDPRLEGHQLVVPQVVLQPLLESND